MATVTSTLSLVDNMTPTLTKSEKQALNNIRAYEQMSKTVDSLTKSLQSAEKANPNIVKTESYANAVEALEKVKAKMYDVSNGQGTLNTKLKEGDSKFKTIAASSGSYFKSLLGFSVVQKLFSLITGQLDSAISRYDTLNNYTKVMSNLGIAEEAAQASRTRLAEGLKGIPTTLDSAILGVQRLTATNSNVEASTEMFLALNNAILAGGAPLQSQQTALEQMTQAYAKGKPDMMEWRSLQQAMPGQLKQIAKAMNRTTNELGEDLRSGRLSMNDFMATVVELNQKGIDGFDNFEQQAKNATNGIQTSVANLKSAISRGLVSMIEGANASLESAGLPTIQEMITNLGTGLETSLTYIGNELIPNLISDLGFLGQSLDATSVQFDTTGDAATRSALQSLNVWDYFMIGFMALSVGIHAAVGFIRLALQYLWIGMQTVALGGVSAFNFLLVGIEGVMDLIVRIIQTRINAMIESFNGLIEALNTLFGAFGFAAQKVNKLTWAESIEADIQNRVNSISDSNSTIGKLTSGITNSAQTAVDLNADVYNDIVNSSQKFLNDIDTRFNKTQAAVGGGGGKSSSTYNPNDIRDLLNNVTGTPGSGGSGGGGALKTTSTDDQLLKDEDIQLLLDVATRDYKLNYQQVTPNITLTFGDIRETMDIDTALDEIADKLEEIYDSNLEVG